MPSFPGSFTVPNSQIIPGQITVYPWAKCRVLIDKQVYEGLVEATNTRSADLGAGIATIKFFDSDKAIYNAIKTGQEVEIYLSESSPLLYANKVWGGFLESREFDVDNKIILIVKAKEYLNNLVLQMTAATAQSNKNSFVNVEPGTAIQDLMANYQVDFTSNGVLTGTSSLITADFLNKSIYDSIKQICDAFNYVFYITNDKDLVVRQLATVVATPASDFLTYTDNMNSIKEEDNKELLCNDIIVYGKSTGIVSNSGNPTQDAASIATYGNHAKRLVVSSLSTSADCTNFANAYIAAYKDPLQQFRTVSRLVAFSDPLQYIQVTSNISGLSGQYQIREMTHFYGKTGIRTEMVLSKKISDLSLSLGQLLSRVNAVEQKAFV
jgi:hypothetical protein